MFRLHPSGRHDRWAITSDVGAFTLLPDRSGALVALRSGLERLDFATGALVQVASAPFDPAMFRFNEGGCDPDGRFWVGVMFDPADPDSLPRKGSLHSYTTADGLQPAPDAAELHNGMAWSADGRRMSLSHSERGQIHSFRCDGGHLRSKALFATVPETDGLPDGAALDTLTVAIGVLCMARDCCGASTPTARSTAPSPCRSASRPCAALPVLAWTSSTSPAPQRI